jgi:hypothetical protein
MEMHRSVEPCKSCHKIMDPIGFSLENFDLIGRWRAADDGAPTLYATLFDRPARTNAKNHKPAPAPAPTPSPVVTPTPQPEPAAS